MVYEANYYISGEELPSISIPGISEILIIGNSQTAMEFSLKLKDLARFKKIYHVDGIKNAAGLMSNVSFAIIVIDADDEFDPVSCSRIIRIHNSNSRIVMISKEIDQNLVIDLKNKGIIHGFISIPCDALMAHTIIVQEQAKYHINQSLGHILVSPPKHSTTSRTLSTDQHKLSSDARFDLLGIAIVVSTVTKYNIFFDTNLRLHPYLLSSYFSTISKIGTKLMHSGEELNIFEFEDFTIYLKKSGDIQYVYFMKNLNEENQKNAEQLILTISNTVHITFGEEINKVSMLTEVTESEITKLITSHLPSHQHETYFYESEDKVKIINFHEPSKTLTEIYDETSRAYEIHYIDDDTQLMDMLTEGSYEIIVVNNFEEEFSKNKTLINIVKDESPFTQSIATIANNDEIPLANVLNINDLDFILNANADIDDYYSILKKAVERSRSIKEGARLSDLTHIPRSYDQSEIIKTMLRRNIDKFDVSTVPEFNGLFILVENMKFYSNYLVEDKTEIEDNEFLFIGFIESLLTFTDEITNSPLALTGIKYGNSNLIVQTHFEYTFIYFIGKLDSTNYDLVRSALDTKTVEMYETIKSGEDSYFISDEISDYIDQICLELSIQFSVLEKQDL